MLGAVELAEEVFHEPVRVGTPQNVKGRADITSNPIYSTGVGLLLCGLKAFEERGGLAEQKEEVTNTDFLGSARQFFRRFM